MYAPNILIFGGVALVVFLLIVLVIQASLARMLLQEINGNNVLHQSNSMDTQGDISSPIIQTYGMIVDANASHTLLSTYGPPPAQSGYAVCEDSAGNYSMQSVTYPTTCWLPLMPTSNTTRFQRDVASGAVTTIMIANVSAKVWLATWPGEGDSPDVLFIIAPVSSAHAIDKVNYRAVITVDPIFTSSTQSSWGSLVNALTSGDAGSIPVHVWAF